MSPVESKQAPGVEGGRQSEWSPVVVLFCVGTFMFWAGLYVYVPVLSVYARSMGASLTLVGLVVSAYGLTQLLVRVPVGFYSDVVGRRKPFILAGMVAVMVGCLGLAWSPDPWFLVASRAMLGVGASMWVAFSVSFAGFFAANRTAHAMAVIGFINSGAQALAGLVGGFLSQQMGTTSTFYAGVAIAFVGLLAMLPVPERVHARPTQMSVGRLAAIARTPSLIVAAGIAIVTTYVNFTTTLSFTPIYARALGATDADLGILATAAALATTVAVLFGATVADRIGDRWVVVIGLVAMGLPTALVPFTAEFWPLLATQVIVGLGRGICTPTLMSLSIRSLPLHERASGMGIYQAVYSIGMFVGPPLSGAVADQIGLASVFYLTAAFCTAGAGWAWLSRGLSSARAG